MRAASSLLLIAGLVAAPVAARATPTFPEAVGRALSAPTPVCSICHAGGVTGLGTVTTSFGKAMRARGLVAHDEASLTAALSRMEAEKVDSNGNVIPDVDELRAGKDPSSGAAQPQLEYGCSVGRGRGQGGRCGLLLLVGLTWLLARRRPARGHR